VQAEAMLQVDARVESLAAVRAFVERACRLAGVDSSACFDLKLAVDEACANIIAHGYRGRSGGSIRIACASDEGSVRVTILDRGRPFAPAELPAADVTSDWKERPLGGLGWHLIRQSVDEIDYEPDPAGGNRLTLVKRSRK
jgi:anti-sigma regulatory factor (Ser/Thr protein kinase)